MLNADLFRNLDLETLGEAEINNLKNTIKETIILPMIHDEFFATFSINNKTP